MVIFYSYVGLPEGVDRPSFISFTAFHIFPWFQGSKPRDVPKLSRLILRLDIPANWEPPEKKSLLDAV